MFVGNLSELLMRGLKHYHLGSSMQAQGSVRRKKITHLKNAQLVVSLITELVSDCCLTSTQQFFGYIMARTSKVSMLW